MAAPDASAARREVDCPLCEGYGTLRDFLDDQACPATCWYCGGWGKVAVSALPAGEAS